MLKSKECREALGKSEIIKLFDDFATKANYADEITCVDDVLLFIINNDDWFNLIFK